MSSQTDLEANLESAQRSRIHSFNPADQEMIEQLRQKYRERSVIPCTRCGYCLPCPNGVNIPLNFEIFSDSQLHEDISGGRFWYHNTLLLEAQSRAGACLGCQDGESHCPQGIPISEWLPKIHEALEGTTS